MGGASAPPFFCHFPFKIGDLEAHPVKICLPLIFLCLPQILIRGRQRKIRGRQILPGSAPKNPDFKGKVTKKGRSRGSSHISIQI